MSVPAPNCVLLADRHHGLSAGVRGLLETVFSQVFIVADQESLLEGARRLSPALVVVDISLAGGDIADLLRSIRARAPASRVLLLSVHDEPRVAVAAFAAGADGLVLKHAIGTELLQAVDTLLAGERYISSTSIHTPRPT